MEEDDACFCGGDGWFPQLFEVMEGGEGKLELLEVFARQHELWGLQVPLEVMGKAVTSVDVVEKKSWLYRHFRFQKVK